MRVEKRLDGSLAVRHGERYLPVRECAVAGQLKVATPKPETRARRATKRGSDWNKDFDFNKGPKVWQAARESGHRKGEAIG